jgi:hypothetical protein
LPDTEEPESPLANALYVIRNENAIERIYTQRVANSRGTEQHFQYIASTASGVAGTLAGSLRCCRAARSTTVFVSTTGAATKPPLEFPSAETPHFKEELGAHLLCVPLDVALKSMC